MKSPVVIKGDITKPLEEITSTLVRAATFVGKLIGAPAEVSAGILTDTLRDFRAGNLERIYTKWEKKIADKGVSQAAFEALPVGIGYRLIEAASFEDDDGVQELWAGLIASNVDPGSIKKGHIETLRSLGPLEAKILKYQWLRYLEGDMNPGSAVAGPHSEFMDRELVHIGARERYVALQNLARMQCIRVLLSDYYLDMIDDSQSAPFGREVNAVERMAAVRRMFNDLSSPDDAYAFEEEGSTSWPELDYRITELGIDLMGLCERN